MNVVIALVLLFLLIALSIPAMGAQRKSEANKPETHEKKDEGMLIV
jgi:hypothetical protein